MHPESPDQRPNTVNALSGQVARGGARTVRYCRHAQAKKVRRELDSSITPRLTRSTWVPFDP